jgi:hypothetical protein
MRQLLQDELRKAALSAIGSGATPQEVAELLAERRRALAELRPEGAAEPEQPSADERPSGDT